MKIIDRRLWVLILAVMLPSCHAGGQTKAKNHASISTEKKLNSDDTTFISNGTTLLKGPKNTAGRDLIAIYEEYRAYLDKAKDPKSEAASFKSRNTMVRIVDGSVIIDAVASGEPDTLAADLRSLGAKKVTVFGRIVSCQLPISAIPALNELASLQFARPAYAITNPGFVK